MSTIPEKDLPPGRHRVLREHLMREITNEANETPPVRRVWRRPAFVAPAVAGVLSVAVVLGVTVTRDVSEPPRPQTVSRESAAELLERIARAAEKERLPDVEDDQFVYTKTESYHWKGDDATKLPDGCAMTLEGFAYGIQELWESVDGQHVGLRREHKENGEKVDRTIARQLPGKRMPNYLRQVEELPTDPEAMYRWLYDLGPGEQPSGKRADDVEAYRTVVGLLAYQLLPPKTAAAIYRAAARVPGLTVVEDVEDAAGRHGVAVAMNDASVYSLGSTNFRTELIFDKKSLDYLGESTVETTAPKNKCDVLDVGDVVVARAIIDREVVDKAGEQP